MSPAKQNERTGTDQLVRRLIEALSVEYWEQGEGTPELKRALRGWSKADRGRGPAKPEFAFVSGGFLVIVEDKASVDRATLVERDGTIPTSFPTRADFATNGAVHYAQNIIARSSQFREVIAVGVAGDSHHHVIQPAYVSANEVRLLDSVDSLEDLAPGAIGEFYRVAVRGELPKVERELRDVRQVAAELHEDMRNYGSLEGERKATTVSAILLALRLDSFELSDLKGSAEPEQTDGWKIYNAAKAYLHKAKLQPEQKVGALLDQFAFLREHPKLNTPVAALGGVTPLKKFAITLERRVLDAILHSPFDVLGNFYGEFVRYGGADGNSLGIVLTPHHITTLMAELIRVNSDDYVLDPTAGTAAFLIAAMNRMIAQAKSSPGKQDEIKEKRLFGVELQDKLFAIGVTNMILRGDGKANFRRDDIFHVDLHDLRGDVVHGDGRVETGHGFTKVLMNPPYSQAKNEQTRHLSEFSFVLRALSALNSGGRLAAIVPQSVMVGKSGWERALKAKLLKAHTLDAVITMNPETFHGVGVNTAVVLFTAGEPHPPEKKVAFVDFRKDGYVTRQHVGLVSDGTEVSRRKHLLSVLSGDADDDTEFVVKSVVNADDEWLHSYFYFNESAPTLNQIRRVGAAYVSWQADTFARGDGDLLTASAAPSEMVQAPGDAEALYADIRWGPVFITDVFESMKASTAWFDRSKEKAGDGRIAFLSQSERNNGVTGIVGHQGFDPEPGNAITVTLKTHSVFYQPTEFYTAQNFLLFRHSALNELSAVPLVATMRVQFDKFSWGYGVSMARLRRMKVIVPVRLDGSVDWPALRSLGAAVVADAARSARDALTRWA